MTFPLPQSLFFLNLLIFLQVNSPLHPPAKCKSEKERWFRLCLRWSKCPRGNSIWKESNQLKSGRLERWGRKGAGNKKVWKLNYSKATESPMELNASSGTNYTNLVNLFHHPSYLAQFGSLSLISKGPRRYSEISVNINTFLSEISKPKAILKSFAPQNISPNARHSTNACWNKWIKAPLMLPPLDFLYSNFLSQAHC